MFGTNQRKPFFFLKPVVFASLVLCQFLIICIITSQKNICHFKHRKTLCFCGIQVLSVILCGNDIVVTMLK